MRMPEKKNEQRLLRRLKARARNDQTFDQNHVSRRDCLIAIRLPRMRIEIVLKIIRHKTRMSVCRAQFL